MGEIIMRNWNLGEFRVRVNSPFPVQQVRVPIRRLITPITGLPTPIIQVVPLISHILSYAPHCSHLHLSSLFFSSTTQQALQNAKLSHCCLTLHLRIMSWHWVQHTPNTVYTKDCLSSLYSHDYDLTAEGCFSFRRASLYEWPPSASSQTELKGKVPLSHCRICELTSWWIESQHLARCPSTVSKYSSKVAPLWPPNWNKYGLQVHLQTQSIIILECITKFTRSRPPSVCPNTLHYRLEVHLHTRSISTSKYIPKLARLWPASSHGHDLQGHLQTGSITASECIPEFTRSSFSGPPPIALQHHLQPVQIYRVRWRAI
jgi:hypothetical protein